jgi:sugar lactone lactonase YvrE
VQERETTADRRCIIVARSITRPGLLVLLTAIVGGGTPSAIAAEVPLETVATFDAHAQEYPEGVGLDGSGNIYVSLANTGEIRRIASDGAQSTVARIHVAGGYVLGLAVAPDGAIYVAVPATPQKDFGLWRIVNGTASRVARLDPQGFPNDVAIDATGNVYVSDSALGAVWKVAPTGAAAIWIQDPLLTGDRTAFGFGANGLELRDGALFVNNTSTGSIVRVPIQADGTAGSGEVFFQDPALIGADGLAFDVSGNAYVTTDGLQNTLVKVFAEGTVQTLATATDGLDYPASIAFGPGDDASSLYIANVGAAFRTPSVMRAVVGP